MRTAVFLKPYAYAVLVAVLISGVGEAAKAGDLPP